MEPAISELAAFYNLDRQVSANFVMRCTGEYRDDRGSSRGISSSTDRAHLIHLRSQADAVITGGGTARTEAYSPTSRFETYVFSRTSAAEGLHRLQFVNLEALREVFTDLKLKHARILVEAGPKLLNVFIDEGLVDTLFVSVVHDARSCSCFAWATSSPDKNTALISQVLRIPAAATAKTTVIANTALTRYDCGEP